MRVRLSIIIMILVTLTGCGKPSHQYQGYVEGENIYLSTPFSGVLMKMLVHRGEQVKKGQLLFALDPKPQSFSTTEVDNQLVQAVQLFVDLKKPKRPPEIDAIMAKIAQANAQLSLATIRVRRNRILSSKHYLDNDSLDASIERLHESKALLDEYTANLTLAKMGARPNQILAQGALARSLREKLKLAKWQAEQKQIIAPDDGVIFDTYFTQGEWVTDGRPIASLLTHNNTRIEFFVPLNQLADLSIGKDILFYYDGTSNKKKAKISYISPEAEYMPPLIYSRDNNDKLVFRIKAQVECSERLIPGEPVVIVVESDHA
ncbi:MAG: HlyD family efflux transporter periplasmic adaptor subunit [Legionellaceae bacterium]|nr:HlyD family efflux transporter periplasmic adaptor subunit [Legionellaceae bacterium]